MKKFITLVAAAVVSITAVGQEKEWNISSFEAAEYKAETTIDGLTIYATDGGPVTIDSNKKTVDGVQYTKRLKTGGAGSFNDGVYSRVISFDVPSNGTVTLIATSSNSNDTRNVGVSFGEFIAFPKEGDNPSGFYALEVEPGDPQVKTVQYDGVASTKVYIYSKSGGVNFYDFKFTPAEGGAGFEWEPVSLFPSTYDDITFSSSVESIGFQCYAEGAAMTEVMPMWVDEDNNEIKAVSGRQDDWNPNQFFYNFNFADFKSNGEYLLVFPEGMILNAAGEKSKKIEIPYTFDIPQLAPPMFADFQILSISPDLSEPQAIWNDQLMTINTNHNEAIGVTTLTITDTATGESVVPSSNFASGRQLGEESPISWEVVGSYKFLNDRKYKAEIVFYNGVNEYDSETGTPTKVVDRVTYEFTGKVEPYKFSDVTLLSVDPYPDSIVISEPDQAVFSFLFSGPVNVYKVVTPLGQNGNVAYPESCLSSNDDKTLWTLNISDQEYLKTVQTQLTLAIYANDLNGSTVEGNEGVDAASHFEFNWQCEVGAKPIVIVSPVAGSTIDSLQEVVVKSADGEAMTWSWNGEAKILDQYDMLIGTLVYDEPAEGEEASATEFRFTHMLDDFWTKVPLSNLTEGYYTIMFDPGCFNFGEQFEDAKSRSVTSTFTIGGDTQANLKYASTYPEVGAVVKTLDTILINYSEPVTCEEFEVNVYSAIEGLVTTGVGKMDNMEPTMVVITLKEPITAEGKYSVIVPAGVIINGDYYESNGEKGLCNEEFSLNYTVGEDSEQPGVDPAEQETFNYTTVDPADGSTVTELSHIDLIFPDVVVTMNDVAYVYKAGAETEPIANASVNWDFDNDLLIKVDLTTPITEAGNYVVVIPARTIGDDPFAASDGKNGSCNPEIRLNYTVGPDDGSGVVSVDAVISGNVYDINGRIVIRNASATDIRSLDKGVYIIGGKKVVK